ncbi:unnamed protein product, partial [Amoebophrya sp. A120]
VLTKTPGLEKKEHKRIFNQTNIFRTKNIFLIKNIRLVTH